MSTKTLNIPLEVRPKQYIEVLQSRRVTVERIAESLGISVRMVYHMKKFDLEPRWSIGLKLIELHLEHCSTATAVA